MNEKYYEISKLSKDEIIKKYGTNINGLSEKEAKKRLEENGKNTIETEKKRSALYFYITSFNDKFVFILFFLAIIDFLLNDKVGSIIILLIGCFSSNIKFVQNYSVYKFNEKLKSKMKTKVNVLRDGIKYKISTENLVKGDVIYLNSGVVVPADCTLISNKDLFINESSFTGENVPREKKTGNKDNKKEFFEMPDICYMNSSVVSGSGTAVVISTGLETYIGNMKKEIKSTKKEKTNFQKGIDSITKMLIRYMVFTCLIVLIIYGVIRGNPFEAVMFALSVAVGITPSMLPMIVNVNLSLGAKVLAKEKVLVKDMDSIQNLGAMDTLCTDKTGTLTENEIILQKYVDIEGKSRKYILKDAYLNASLSTGEKNFIDKAIISYATLHNATNIKDYEKVDEIPFDFERKKSSIAIKNKSGKYIVLTKGALSELLKICTKVKVNEKEVKLTKEYIDKALSLEEEYSKEGMQVIALATKDSYSGVGVFDKNDEKSMTLEGLIAFLDPPKKSVKDVLKNLKKYGVNTKIITGDNKYTTNSICSFVGIESKYILEGSEIEKMSKDELKKKVEECNIFVRTSPIEKELIVKTLRENGHVVGYMGDGVNDAPSLNNADVGISVNTGVDAAKESADIILLKKDLSVIFKGVLEGRKVYGNITKYMKLALSSDFGDVFSIVLSSLALPFLPLLPIQMLLQDFLFDFSQIAIPYDDVDEEFIRSPRKWDTKNLSHFMNVMGITSSIIDVLAFIGFWFGFGYKVDSYFQTAWFVECLISEAMIVYFVRTSKKPFIESHANIHLVIGTTLTIIFTILSPILLHNIKSFHFEIVPLKYYLFVLVLLVIYALLVDIVKYFYIKKYKEWL